MGISVGLDASRIRSGGGVAHLLGILTEGNPSDHGIETVHVWTHPDMIGQLPDRDWLKKHTASALSGSLVSQLLWQARSLPVEAENVGCDLLFAVDASTLCKFEPMVVMSQDMLSYEPGVMKTFGLGLSRLRLEAILRVQNAAFRRAAGVIFLTKYARDVIERSCGALHQTVVIPHGIDAEFETISNEPSIPQSGPIRCLYVSNASMYKYQWTVVEAIQALREDGHNIELQLVGGGSGPAQRLLEEQMASSDPNGEFVFQTGFVGREELRQHLKDADVFVFASACENMPITLLEAMLGGLPIACSNRGPMPEVLGDAGTYFDPADFRSIASAIEALVQNDEERRRCAREARERARKFTWLRCANETWKYLELIHNQWKQNDS